MGISADERTSPAQGPTNTAIPDGVVYRAQAISGRKTTSLSIGPTKDVFMHQAGYLQVLVAGFT